MFWSQSHRWLAPQMYMSGLDGSQRTVLFSTCSGTSLCPIPYTLIPLWSYRGGSMGLGEREVVLDRQL